MTREEYITLAELVDDLAYESRSQGRVEGNYPQDVFPDDDVQNAKTKILDYAKKIVASRRTTEDIVDAVGKVFGIDTGTIHEDQFGAAVSAVHRILNQYKTEV